MTQIRMTREMRGARFEMMLGRPLASKRDFIEDVRRAVDQSRPLAAGRLGHSPQFWLYYPLAIRTGLPRFVARTLQARLWQHAVQCGGVFPGDPESMLAFNDFFARHLQDMDWLGLTLDQPVRELAILERYAPKGRLLYYMDLVPDRSAPSDERLCYLRLFAGRRVLLVCPFAGALRDRATQAIFEGVWAKTGKRWFQPASVEALEFPYGSDPVTHQRFGTAENLFEHIAAQMGRLSFDVALIAAAGLAIPLASAARQMGRIAIDLGGDLQVLFGVLGRRWRERADWQRKYINERWIDVPARYKPVVAETGGGDYW